MHWRTRLNQWVMNTSSDTRPAAGPSPARPLVLAVLTSTRTPALRTVESISALTGVPKREVAAILATLEREGSALHEWNGMEHVWSVTRPFAV